MKEIPFSYIWNDQLYYEAKKQGALGGKVIGAGGGGFLMIYCDKNHEKIKYIMEKLE